MSFSPVVPLSGYAGWSFLKRTMESQKAAFEQNPALKRDEDYFRAKIGSIKTAEALVSDKRLLRVALGAFGLSDDVNNTYFIRKVLEDGTLKVGALANKLADKQYAAFSVAFGFGDYSTPRTQLSDFPDMILKKYRQQEFEVAVGASNSAMRLALFAERELPALADKALSEDGKWFTIMGSPPLRAVFESAFGLPSSFATLDLDRQLSVLKDKARAMFGGDSVSQFADTGQKEKLLRNYLVRSDLPSGELSNMTKGATALQILQQRQFGAL